MKICLIAYHCGRRLAVLRRSVAVSVRRLGNKNGFEIQRHKNKRGLVFVMRLPGFCDRVKSVGVRRGAAGERKAEAFR